MKKEPTAKGKRKHLGKPLTDQSNKSEDLRRMERLKWLANPGIDAVPARLWALQAERQQLGRTEAFIGHRLHERYKHTIGPFKLSFLVRSPAIAMELWDLWDHVAMITDERNTSNKQLVSSRYLAREIR